MTFNNYELIILMIQNRNLAIQIIEAQPYKENVKQYKIYFNEVEYLLRQEGDIKIYTNSIKKMENNYYSKFQIERKLINILDNVIQLDSILYNEIKREYKKKYGKNINIDNFYKSNTDKLHSN